MLPQVTSEFYCSEIVNTAENTTLVPRKKVAALKALLSDFLRNITIQVNQHFSGDFPRLVFIADKYQFPAEIRTPLKTFRYFASNLQKDASLPCSIENFNYCAAHFYQSICYLTENAGDDFFGTFKSYFDSLEILSPQSKPRYENAAEVDFLEAIVLKKGRKYLSRAGAEFAELYCESVETGEFKLLLTGIWLDIYKISWIGAALNIINISRAKSPKSKLPVYAINRNSIIALEPDYLIDVTDIAECFQKSGPNKYLYLLKKFMPGGLSYQILAGNIINNCLDELLIDPEASFEKAYDRAIKARPLQAFALAAKDSLNIKLAKEKAESQFDRLREISSGFNPENAEAEPSFISPKYGVQGRLDVLSHYPDDISRKDIIELKSGSAPDIDYVSKTWSGESAKTGIWPNHFAQATLYNILIDSAFPGRGGSSMIFYSASKEKPIRNAPNIIQKKQETIRLRNWFASLEQAFSCGHLTALKKISPERIGPYPRYLKEDIYEFARIYSNLKDYEREYFHNQLIFITREIMAGKTGDSGYSSLWRKTVEEKENSYSIIYGLKIDVEESDFTNLRLCLINTVAGGSNSFRAGDIAILCRSDINNGYNSQVYKGVIKDISSRGIIFSFRNKQIRKNVFLDGGIWNLEPDYIETTQKKLFNSIYEFIKSPKGKKELLFGLKKPRFGPSPAITEPDLNENQNMLLNMALAAEDYFLIQGPPGTGKTSYMLRYIVKYLYERPGENLLLAAYTNKAADEICSALLRISPDFNFIRLGSKEASIHKKYNLPEIVSASSMREAYIRLRKSRVCVSTVSSVLSSPEIFHIKSFTTAIIDEASQILEAQIVGILSRINKFIMIGDERQLPAIVTQGVGISSESAVMPVFERLANNAKNKGWIQAYGLLQKQARMHAEIMEFPNTFFYKGRLKTFDELGWQNSKNSFIGKTDTALERVFTNSRVAFIDFAPEKTSKLSKKEAAAALTLIQDIREFYGDEFCGDTVGVISPFRAQCAEIRRGLPEEIKNLVTVDTIERFQGSERDIIIFSFAVNSGYLLQNACSPAEIEGDTIDRKLNVAMTRAKKFLVFAGSSKILSTNHIYSELINFIKSKGGFLSYNNFKA